MVGIIMPQGRSTVRIVREAIRLLEQSYSHADETAREEISHNIDELDDLAKSLHNMYPIMRSGDHLKKVGS